MERFFRSFKSEWMPEIGYRSFATAEKEMSSYTGNFYSPLRAHRFKGEKTLAVTGAGTMLLPLSM